MINYKEMTTLHVRSFRLHCANSLLTSRDTSELKSISTYLRHVAMIAHSQIGDVENKILEYYDDDGGFGNAARIATDCNVKELENLKLFYKRSRGVHIKFAGIFLSRVGEVGNE